MTYGFPPSSRHVWNMATTNVKCFDWSMLVDDTSEKFLKSPCLVIRVIKDGDNMKWNHGKIGYESFLVVALIAATGDFPRPFERGFCFHNGIDQLVITDMRLNCC